MEKQLQVTVVVLLSLFWIGFPTTTIFKVNLSEGLKVYSVVSVIAGSEKTLLVLLGNSHIQMLKCLIAISGELSGLKSNIFTISQQLLIFVIIFFHSNTYLRNQCPFFGGSFAHSCVGAFSPVNVACYLTLTLVSFIIDSEERLETGTVCSL